MGNLGPNMGMGTLSRSNPDKTQDRLIDMFSRDLETGSRTGDQQGWTSFNSFSSMHFFKLFKAIGKIDKFINLDLLKDPNPGNRKIIERNKHDLTQPLLTEENLPNLENSHSWKSSNVKIYLLCIPIIDLHSSVNLKCFCRPLPIYCPCFTWALICK